MVKKKISFDKRADDYTDFYERFTATIDIDEFLEEGAGASFQNFRDLSSKKGDAGYHKVMFNRRVKAGTSSKLGEEIWHRFVKDGRIAVDNKGRLHLGKGLTETHRGKIYKGGNYLPKTILARRF